MRTVRHVQKTKLFKNQLAADALTPARQFGRPSLPPLTVGARPVFGVRASVSSTARPSLCPALHAFTPSHPPTCCPETTRAARDTAADALPLPTTNAPRWYSCHLVPAALGVALWVATPAAGHDARNTNYLLGEVLRRHL